MVAVNAVRARIASSAAPFARRYAWKTGSSAVACGSAAIAEIIRYRLDTGGFCGVGQQDRRVAVDGLLACRAAARTRPGGEHDGVGAAQVLRDLLGRSPFQIHDKRFGARRFQVRGLGRLPDDSGDGVAAPREQPFEVKGDLAVSACDDDAHWIPLSVGAQRRWRVRAPVVSGV